MPEDFEGVEALEKLIDELESFAQKTPFFFPHKVVIPDHEFFRISMAIREAIPHVVRDAKTVLAERTSIIENAKQEHKRILETAERRAQELIREDVIVKEAQSEAESIIARARAEAEELKREALLYTEELLETLSRDFENAIETVNNGRRLIRKFLEKGKETSSTTPVTESISETEQS